MSRLDANHVDYFSLSSNDLAANQQGALTPAQQQMLARRVQTIRSIDAQVRGLTLAIGPILMLLISGVLGGTMLAAGVPQEVMILVFPILLLFLAFYFFQSLIRGSGKGAARRAYQHGALNVVEGILTIKPHLWDETGSPFFAVHIGRQWFISALNRDRFDERIFHALIDHTPYRVFYIGDRILTVEPLSPHAPSRERQLPPLGEAFGFDAADLAANRMGNLSDPQRRRFAVLLRSSDWITWIIILILLSIPVLPAVIIIAAGQMDEALAEMEATPVYALAYVVMTILVAMLILWAILHRVGQIRSLRSGAFAVGTVKPIEGIVQAKQYSQGDSETVASYRVRVNDRWVELRPFAYEGVEEGRAYRFYQCRGRVISAELL